MGQFTIKEQTNSATYEYINDDIIVNGNYQKDGTTGELKNINGTCYDNNDGEPGRYIGNFSGYMRDGEVRYSISEMSRKDSNKVWDAIDEIEPYVMGENTNE